MQPLQVFLEQMAQLVGGYIPNLIAALAILIIGWLVALILSAIVRGVLRRTTLDDRLARWAGSVLPDHAFRADRFLPGPGPHDHHRTAQPASGPGVPVCPTAAGGGVIAAHRLDRGQCVETGYLAGADRR